MIICNRDGRRVYHWPASIAELVEAKKGKTSAGKKQYRELLEDAKNASADWQLCACGSLCDAIPRKISYRHEASPNQDGVIPALGCPIDDELSNLGGEFCADICGQHFDRALNRMNSIEIRAGEILHELGKRKKNYGKPILK